MNSILLLLKHKPNIRILIAGDGPLNTYINRFIKDNNLENNVSLSSWISHEDLPDFFNKFKLIIIPSFTEGLPNVMLESMACGTPVLA